MSKEEDPETCQLFDFEKNMLAESEADYYTSEEQKVKIKEGQEQIARGNYYTNEQVEKEIDEWLSK